MLSFTALNQRTLLPPGTIGSSHNLEVTLSPFAKILLAIVLFPVLLIVLLVLMWDPNWFKTDIDQQLKNVPLVNLQFEQIDHSLMQPGKLGMTNIVLDGDLVKGSIQSFQVDVAVKPLMNKQAVVQEIKLVNPVLHVNLAAVQAMSEQSDQEVKDAPQAQQPLPIQSANLQRLVIENAEIKDISDQKLFAVTGLNITLSNVQLVKNSLPITPETLPPVAIELSTNSTELTGQSFGKLLINALGNSQQLTLNQFQMLTDQSDLNLSGSVNSPLSEPMVNLNIDQSALSIDEFSGLLGDLPIKPGGVVNVAGKLEEFAVQEDLQAMLQSLNGDINIGIDQGMLRGIDINQIVQAIKDSRETDAKDIGSFLLTGPVGILASQIVDLGWGGDSFHSDYQTQIPQLRFNSAITNGVLNLQDTAFATDEFRMAFDGGVDVGNFSFADFTFSILDDAGCADIQQTLNGAMDDPSSAVTDTLVETLISPLKGLLKNVAKQVDECEPVYEGEVVHPGE